MNWKELGRKISPYLPTIKQPSRELSFKERLKYTFFVLIAYFLLSSMFLIGLSKTKLKEFEFMSTILAAQMGTIISLGIGPIISGMIVFELLVSSGIIKMDIKNPEDRIYYNALQKLFAIIFIIYENSVLVFGGMLIPENFAPFPIPQLFLLAQLVLGGILLLLLDDIVGKYGIGSGISLFILASVSETVFTRALNPFPVPGSSVPSGKLLAFIYEIIRGNLWSAFIMIIPSAYFSNIISNISFSFVASSCIFISWLVTSRRFMRAFRDEYIL
jgi:preprotein translocase subunit SecY